MPIQHPGSNKTYLCSGVFNISSQFYIERVTKTNYVNLLIPSGNSTIYMTISYNNVNTNIKEPNFSHYL